MTRSDVGFAAGVVLLLGLTGCASSSPESEPAVPPPLEHAVAPGQGLVDRTFVRGLVALKLQHYDRARLEVGRVALACEDDPIGAQALLTLAAAELDPRNPGGDPQLARELVERFLQAAEKPAWTEPLAETLYLLALDRGAMSPRDTASSPPNGNGTRAARTGEDEGPYIPARDEGTRPGTDPDRLLPLASPDFTPTPAECAEATGVLRSGALEAPVLPRMPLAEQMAELTRVRDSLQARADAKERELAELRQELERIRETLRP